jgi:Fe-S-cluster containining protein
MERVDIPVLVECGDSSFEGTASVPAGEMRPADLLPILLRFTDAIVALGADAARRAGDRISCRAGCGACCRQLVPISEAEAIYLSEVVEAMPPHRREAVRARFAEAVAGLGEDLVARIRDTAGLKDIESRRAVGLEYFARRVACPFLVDESCSIHEHRPAACREYLVTSPAVNCRTPAPDTLRKVAMPVKPSTILYCFGDGIGNQTTRWLPLVLALEWADARRDAPQPLYDAPQMFRNFIAQVRRWSGS